MTYYVIEDVRKNRSDLLTTSDYINYMCGKRIKTINIKYKAEVEPLEMENVIVNSLPDDAEPFKYEYIPESDHDNDLTVNIMKCENDIDSRVIMDTTITDSDVRHTSLNNPDNTKSNPEIEKTSSVAIPVPKIEEKSPAKKENNSVLKNVFFQSDIDDSSNDASFHMDGDADIEKSTNENLEKTSANRTSKRVAKKKEDKKVVNAKNPDACHKFVGIIREPKGELSEGNWETKLLTEEEALEQFQKKEFDSKYERMEFKCTKCFKGFSKNDMLLRHNKMWHEKVFIFY